MHLITYVPPFISAVDLDEDGDVDIVTGQDAGIEWWSSVDNFSLSLLSIFVSYVKVFCDELRPQDVRYAIF